MLTTIAAILIIRKIIIERRRRKILIFLEAARALDKTVEAYSSLDEKSKKIVEDMVHNNYSYDQAFHSLLGD